MGFGKAVEIAVATMEERTAKEREMRDYLIDRILKEIPYSRLNGHRTQRLPGNANFCFRFIEGESMLIMLDFKGICASSGSACTSGSLDPSHVLLAIGLPHEIAHGSLRLTLNETITVEDIDYVVESVKEIIANLRSMSPLYEKYVKNANQAKDVLSVIIDNAKQVSTPTAQPIAQPVVAPASSSVADELAKLAKLKADGILTDEEFQAQKSKLLGL